MAAAAGTLTDSRALHAWTFPSPASFCSTASPTARSTACWRSRSVLVFAVTRVIFIPQGEFVAYGALTLALFQLGKVPGTVWLLLVLAALGALIDLVDAIRRGLPAQARSCAVLVRTLVAPAIVTALTVWAAPLKLHLLVQSALTLAIVTLLGPLVYRLAYQRLADASVLVLLIVSVGVHFALTGLGLVFFGAEGFRNPSFWDVRFAAGPLTLSGQTIFIFIASIVLIVALYLFFERTLARQGACARRP